MTTKNTDSDDIQVASFPAEQIAKNSDSTELAEKVEFRWNIVQLPGLPGEDEEISAELTSNEDTAHRIAAAFTGNNRGRTNRLHVAIRADEVIEHYPATYGLPASLVWACCRSIIGPACPHRTAS